MQIFKSFLFILLFSIAVLGIYNLLKHFVLKKIKVSKWIILVIGIIVFLIPPIPGMPISEGTFSIIKSTIFVFLFLWWIDLITGNMDDYKLKKKQQIKIKPKAKPNRVKNINTSDKASSKK